MCYYPLPIYIVIAEPLLAMETMETPVAKKFKVTLKFLLISNIAYCLHSENPKFSVKFVSFNSSYYLLLLFLLSEPCHANSEEIY